MTEKVLLVLGPVSSGALTIARKNLQIPDLKVRRRTDPSHFLLSYEELTEWSGSSEEDLAIIADDPSDPDTWVDPMEQVAEDFIAQYWGISFRQIAGVLMSPEVWDRHFEVEKRAPVASVLSWQDVDPKIRFFIDHDQRWLEERT